MYQFFAPLAEPVGAVWLLMSSLAIWLLCRRQWRCAILLGCPTILLFILGSTSVAEMLVAAEEKPWIDAAITATLDNAPADAVVALGGGQHLSRHDPLGFAMGGGGSRVLTAVELVRRGKARTLVLGGSWPTPANLGQPAMRRLQDWVNSWGLVRGAVTNLGICHNTHDEGVAFGKLAHRHGWLEVILVTSALHMRRSMALFQYQGITVKPIAADFQVQGVSQDLPFSPFPRQHRFYLLTLYMHEKIGWWVYRLRGWV